MYLNVYTSQIIQLYTYVCSNLRDRGYTTAFRGMIPVVAISCNPDEPSIFSIRFQGAIGYSNHRPPQAPQAVETVDAEQDSQRGGGWQHVDYLMDPLTT